MKELRELVSSLVTTFAILAVVSLIVMFLVNIILKHFNATTIDFVTTVAVVLLVALVTFVQSALMNVKSEKEEK